MYLGEDNYMKARAKPFRLKPKAPDGFMTVSQAAQYLGVSTKSIRRYIKDHGLPAAKPAGVYLISKEKLQKWIDEHE